MNPMGRHFAFGLLGCGLGPRLGRSHPCGARRSGFQNGTFPAGSEPFCQPLAPFVVIDSAFGIRDGGFEGLDDGGREVVGKFLAPFIPRQTLAGPSCSHDLEMGAGGIWVDAVTSICGQWRQGNQGHLLTDFGTTNPKSPIGGVVRLNIVELTVVERGDKALLVGVGVNSGPLAFPEEPEDGGAVLEAHHALVREYAPFSMGVLDEILGATNASTVPTAVDFAAIRRCTDEASRDYEAIGPVVIAKLLDVNVQVIIWSQTLLFR